MGGSWGALGAGIWEAVIGAMYHGRERRSLHPTRDSRLPCCHSRGHTHSRSASHTHQHQHVHASPTSILLSAVARSAPAPARPPRATGLRSTLPVSPGAPRVATPGRISVYRHRLLRRAGMATGSTGTLGPRVCSDRLRSVSECRLDNLNMRTNND